MAEANATFEKYRDRWLEAQTCRAKLDERIRRRAELYYGDKKNLSFGDRKKTWSAKETTPFRKMCFELVEAQVDSSVPLAKVTPRYADDIALAESLENFLNLEADLMQSEDINDIAERETARAKLEALSRKYQRFAEMFERYPLPAGPVDLEMALDAIPKELLAAIAESLKPR